MEEFNSAAFYKRVIQKGGKSFSYLKVKNALGGRCIIDDKERKQMLSVLEDIYKEAKNNILKL
jgi:hypothetical protein